MLNNKKVLWFTGLSGSGKTTLAYKVKDELQKKGLKVAIFDGDSIRDKITKKLGFTKEDIWENNKLIANLAAENISKFDVILVPVISPYREHRAKVREIIGDVFNEVYIRASLEECIKRDTKGLYKKAINGEINNLIGFAEISPYESPVNPDLIIDTENLTIHESLSRIINFVINQ